MMGIPTDRITFRHSDLDALSDDEKCIFFQAGIILTDLRFFDLQLLSHMQWFRNSSEQKLDEIENGIILSQITLLLAHLAGTLVEANNVIKSSYYTAPVSKKYAKLLSTDASKALKKIKLYFSNKQNLASVIRNNFGFHYDRGKILNYIQGLDPETRHCAFFPTTLNDAFIEFGQSCSMNALFKATGARNPVDGFFRTYGELGATVTKDFVIFLHGILEAIGKTVQTEHGKVKQNRGANSPALYSQVPEQRP